MFKKNDPPPQEVRLGAGGVDPPPREVHRAAGGKGPSMAKIFAASRRKYQALDGFTDRTATVISSGLMIYKKEPFIRILMPHKNLGLWVFPWPKSEKLTLGKFPIGLYEFN